MKKRLTSLLLAAAMVLTMTASPVFATGGDSQDSGAAIGTSDGICEHHTYHTDECGYVAAVAEQPCQHTHDETCGYAAAVAETPCDMGCTGADGDGNIIHVEGCAYTPAVEEQLCRHIHDDTCGYVAAVEGFPCTYDCAICNGESGGKQTPAGAENTCTCTEKCAEGAGNTDCPVCATDTTLCEGTEQQSAPTCTCTTPCSEGSVNGECPVCSAEGAGLSVCLGQPAAAAADEEAARVQGLIDALPALSEMESMSDDEREAAIVQYTEAYEAYEALTDEQKAQINGAEALEQFAALMQEGVAQTNDTETITITGPLTRQDLRIEKDTIIDLSQAQSGEMPGRKGFFCSF